jgi:hypothetical protein
MRESRSLMQKVIKDKVLINSCAATTVPVLPYKTLFSHLLIGLIALTLLLRSANWTPKTDCGQVGF